MKNKKGSHVGIMLSFVIFVTFAVFIVTIIQPAVSIENNKKATLSYLKNSIMEEISSDLTTATIVIKDNTVQLCVVFENFLSNSNMKPPFVISRSESGENNVYASSDSNSLWINRESDEDIFFKVYNSSEFSKINTGSGSCTILRESQGDYSIGLLKTEEQIFESKIIKLINDYGEFGSTGYESLKNELGISSQSEFSVSFTYSNGIKIEANGGEPATSIYKDESAIQYVSSEASIENGILEISVW